MTALFKFLVLLVIFLLAKLGNVFTDPSAATENLVWTNHLVWFEKWMSKSMHEPSCKQANQSYKHNFQTIFHYFSWLSDSRNSIKGNVSKIWLTHGRQMLFKLSTSGPRLTFNEQKCLISIMTSSWLLLWNWSWIVRERVQCQSPLSQLLREHMLPQSSLSSWENPKYPLFSQPLVGEIWVFLLLDTHFLSEKKGFCGTQHKIQKCPRKNKLRLVARPILPNWLFPLLEVRLPPPWCIHRHTRLLSIALESIEMLSSRPSFPCWEDQDKEVWLKKLFRPRNQVHTSTNSSLL